jgi:DNA-directed RNA polymerase specialized sigma24 family protein
MAPRIPHLPADGRALVSSAQAGDESAFGHLLDQYRRGLELYCLLMLGDPDAAKRAIADTAVTAWQERAVVEPDTSARIWLYRAAVRVCCEATGDPMSLDSDDALTSEGS